MASSIPGFPQPKSVVEVLEETADAGANDLQAVLEQSGAVAATDTTVATPTKPDLITLILVIITNVFYGLVNYFSGNYIGIIYNVFPIIENLLLYFFG